MAEMSSSKPYFVRAIYQWIVDNNKTPFIEVRATLPGVAVPARYVKEGKIILNISREATNLLEMTNDAITFEARFDHKVYPINVPIYAIEAIFAAENGQGMSFPEEPLELRKEKEFILAADENKPSSKIESKEKETTSKKRPKLKLITSSENTKEGKN
jgi:stringent starvation protein B